MNAATINKIAATVDHLVLLLSTNIDMLMIKRTTATQNISLYCPFPEDISDACDTGLRHRDLDPLQVALSKLASPTILTGESVSERQI
jgi:hypothetical protein